MQTYDMAAAQIIIGTDSCKDLVRFEENGVFPNTETEVFPTTETDLLQWIPACELDEPDAPDLLKTPGLPIPFTANELAAFMLHGAGCFLLEKYGDWHGGPDEEALQSMGLLANRAKEAVRGAYAAYRAAYRAAESVIGIFDEAVNARARQLYREYQRKLQEANKKEGTHASRIACDEQGNRITVEEYWARRARATDSVADPYKALMAAQEQADQQSTKWRKAMVKKLLQPQQATPGGRRWSDERTAEMQADRDANGIKKTALKFKISVSRVKQLTAAKKKTVTLTNAWQK